MSGIRIERSGSPNTAITYDSGQNEFRFDRDDLLQETAQSAMTVGEINTGNNETEGFTWRYDSANAEAVFEDDSGNELMRQAANSATQFPQGISTDVEFELTEDTVSTALDVQNSTSTTSGTEVGYTFDVDGNEVARVSALSDGSGGITNKELSVPSGSRLVLNGTDDPNPGRADILLSDPFGEGVISLTSSDNFDNRIEATYEGNGAFTFGRREPATNASTGDRSFVFGGEPNNLLEASGTGSIAAGQATTASGDYSIAHGDNTEASALSAVSFGTSNTSSGPRAFTVGRNLTASGTQSAAFGLFGTSSGAQSFTFGTNNTASGDDSFAAGSGSTASGTTSVAIGNGAEAQSRTSAAFGDSSTASAERSFVVGDNVARVALSVVGGPYAEDYRGSDVNGVENFNASDRVFQIGVGDSPGSTADEFDNRGAKDGLYVTYRNGVFVRDGVSALDNENNSFFDTFLNVRSIYAPPTLSTTGTVGSGTTVAYAVIARTNDGRSLRSPESTIDIDPTNLDSNNFVTISWDSRSAKDGTTVAYIVLKDEGNTGTFEELDTVLGTSFDDTGQATSSITLPTENETGLTQFATQVGNGSGKVLYKESSGLVSETFLTYEENENAYTFGSRSGTIGQNSFAANGEKPISFATNNNAASGDYSFASGFATSASGFAATAQGRSTIASGGRSHAVNNNTEASGTSSFAEGSQTEASGQASHVEGRDTVASGNYSHAQGNDCFASGEASHAGGISAVADAPATTAQGLQVDANIYGESAFGVYNDQFVSNVTTFSNISPSDTVFRVGIGDDASNSVGNFVDGRGYKEGFQITYREGTFLKDGLTVSDDKDNSFFDAGLGIRSIYFRPDLSKTEATSGNLDGTTTTVYAVLVRNGDGERTLISPKNSIDIDNTALDSSNFVTIDWTGSGRERPLNGGVYVVLKDAGNTGSFDILGTTTNTSFDDTGQPTSAFTAPTQNETAVTNLGVNNTADTSGDIQIRDSSSGDLFSLNDGNTPQLVARYEGSGAFTFGQRTGTIGGNSIVIGGDSSFPSEASGSVAIAFGGNTVASGQESVAMGRDTISSNFRTVAMGFGSEANDANAVAMGQDTVASGANSTAMGNTTTSSGDESVSIGSFTTASGSESFAQGSNTTASAVRSVALNNVSTASALYSMAMGTETTASAENSVAAGDNAVSRVVGGLVIGNFNEDYVGAGNEAGDINGLSNNDRAFAVAAGDNPNAASGDPDYFDGRGRVDGLYVTYRNGTFARHGIQVDGWNGSSYVERFKVSGSGVVTTTQNTADTPGDLQIRDESTGNLFSLNDGNSPQLAAQYEGSGAFTFGHRNTSNNGTGDNSTVLSGNEFSGETNEASGFASLATGIGTTASATASTAMGNGTTASGTDATAMGDGTTASGNQSTAMGLSTTASGVNSTAMGSSTIASDAQSVAMGNSTEANGASTVAMGDSTTAGPAQFAVAMGTGTTASGNASFATGDSTTASGAQSTATGNSTEASGTNATAMGNQTTASGGDAVAMGDSTVASSFQATAMGFGAEANASTATAMGSGTIASGSTSTAMGNSTVASGFDATAMGSNTTASGTASTAMGSFTTSSADGSAALGNFTISRVFGGTALGSYNKDYVGFGNEVSTLSGLKNDDRAYAVGLGDRPAASSGDPDFFDGRGRTDGFYVTYRNGTFVRDGIQAVDNGDNTFFDAGLGVRSIYYRPDLSTTGTVGSGTTNAYAVLVRTGEGNRTLISPENTIDVDNTALDGSNFVTIDWTGAGRERPLDGGVYVVLKDTGNTGTFDILGTTTNTSFDDTGQTLSAFTSPTQNETATTTLSFNNTADTSGDIQIRDSSSGDLFSLDDGNTPQLAAQYEGDSAFTFGRRTGNVGTGSVVLNGASGNENEASGNWTVSIGYNNSVSSFGSFVGGQRNTLECGTSFLHGFDNSVTGGTFNVFVAGDTNTVTNSSAGTTVFGDGNTVNDTTTSLVSGFQNDVVAFSSIVAGSTNVLRDPTNTGLTGQMAVFGDGNGDVNGVIRGQHTLISGKDNGTPTGVGDSLLVGEANVVDNGDTGVFDITRLFLIGESNTVSSTSGSDNIYAIGRDHSFEGNDIIQTAVSIGSNNTLNNGASKAVAIGSSNTVSSSLDGHVFGRDSTTTAERSIGIGFDIISRVYSGVSLAVYNEDYVGSGNEVNSLSSLSSNDRIFAVGAGDNPSAVSGDDDFFDGRGRVDGLYVTYRDGTYIKHGLTVDKYNSSLGQYEPQFEVLDDGRIELYDPGQGVVLRSANNTRFEIYVEDDGTIVSEEL